MVVPRRGSNRGWIAWWVRQIPRLGHLPPLKSYHGVCNYLILLGRGVEPGLLLWWMARILLARGSGAYRLGNSCEGATLRLPVWCGPTSPPYLSSSIYSK
jgi:hypothetical protein